MEKFYVVIFTVVSDDPKKSKSIAHSIQIDKEKAIKIVKDLENQELDEEYDDIDYCFWNISEMNYNNPE